MIDRSAFEFLQELAQNNRREWFEANKKRYETTVKKPFETFVEALIERLAAIEGADWGLTPAMCVHRIYRDTRFSKDKTPYKTNAGAILTRGGKKGMDFPGFYVEIAAGHFAVYGGAYMLEKEPLWNVRNAIKQQPERFAELLADADFVKNFGTLRGAKNQRVDPEFKEAAAAQPLIFQKQFYFAAEMPIEKALGSAGIDTATALFRAGKPMNDFLREAFKS